MKFSDCLPAKIKIDVGYYYVKIQDLNLIPVGKLKIGKSGQESFICFFQSTNIT